MNADSENLKKMLSNPVQQHRKRLLYHNQVRIISEIQGCFNIHNLIKVMYHIRRIKDKNHMVISVVPEKAFDTVPNHFMIKDTPQIRNKMCFRLRGVP